MSEIFLINEGQTLVPLSQQAYESEDLLQTLLEKYPSLLAGDQINPKVPRRWLLVKRETDVPGEENGSGRWFLDHLFLDQEGVPTLVEVKRSTDTRIRREVVGQMLDYAANGVKYWPIESLRSYFEQTCETENRDPAEVIGQLIEGGDPEDFWLKVKTNLQAGRIRMLFVADEIPKELRRVVEFLNEQMDPAEVLALEIRQYANDSVKTLVPRVIGLTAVAEDRKKVAGSRVKRKWDEASFLDALKLSDEVALTAARRIIGWANEKRLRIAWGAGTVMGSFYPMFDRGETSYYTFGVFTGYSSPYLQFQFQPQAKQCPPERLRELANRLNQVPGVNITDGDLSRYPSVPLNLLGGDEPMRKFLQSWDWMLEEIERHQPETTQGGIH